MAGLNKSILANFGGQAWAAVLNLAFVPLYLELLGVEAYGLIGFFISLQAVIAILDLGISASLSRQLARYQYLGLDGDTQRDLVRTLEWLYWPLALALSLFFIFASGPISTNWLNLVAMGASESAHAIVLLGLAAGLQWPCSLYVAGFRGLERHVLLNCINVVFVSLRTGGAAAVLVWVSPTLEAFLWWQVVVSASHTSYTAWGLWRLLPNGSRRARFSIGRLEDMRQFAIGLAAISVTAVILTQSDRIILSAILSLDEFGYYVLAATVAFALSTIIQPFFSALYPRFCGLVAAGDAQGLIKLYHQSNQILAATVGSAASVAIFFSEDLIHVWTGDAGLAHQTAGILAVLVTGSAFNGLMNLPYALQLAYGWTRLALYLNIVAATIAPFAIWFLGSHYGAHEAAYVWVAVNLGYVLIGIPLMHRRIARGEAARWYAEDVLPTVCFAVLIAWLARTLTPALQPGAFGFGMLATIAATTFAGASMASSTVRAFMLNRFRSL